MQFLQKHWLLMRSYSTILTFTVPLVIVSLFSATVLGQKSKVTGLTLSRPLVFRWVFDKTNQITVSPGFSGESLYFQSPEGVVSSVGLPGGQLRWRTELGGLLSAPPAADERAVYVASESVGLSSIKSQGVVTALSKSNGITIWSRTLTSPLQSDLLLFGNSLFGITRENRLLCLASETGETRWEAHYPHTLSANLLTTGDMLITSTADGTIASFDIRTGRPAWRYRTRDSLRHSISVNGASVVFGSSDGFVTALEETAAGINFKWRRRVGTSVVGVSGTADGIVVVTADNFVQMLSRKRGSRLWKRRMPGRVFPQPLIESGNALFATLGGDACIVLSLDRGQQVNSLSVGEGNSIVAMPVLTPSALIVPTRQGLMAFTQPDAD